MKRASVAALAVSGVLIGAQDSGAAPFEFAGFYAGAHAGYADMTADFGGGNLDGGDALGGLQAGYNYVNGNLVLGVEADLSAGGGDASGTCPFNGALTCSVDIDLMATLRPRVGYAMNDFLLYATGGLAAARFDIVSRGAGPGTVDDSEEGAYGWTVGAGLEYMLGDIVSVRLEYRYLSFPDVDFNPVLGGPSGMDADIHSVIGGINFHF